MKKKNRVNDNLKIVVETTTILIFITILGFYLFNLYINIDIQKNTVNSQYTATRTSQTIEEINKESVGIADVLEEVSSSVVGISKLQEKREFNIFKRWICKIRTWDRNYSIRRWIHCN